MRYIGIDQSYSGFAVACYDAITEEHLTALGTFTPARYGKGVDRLLAIRRWLVGMLLTMTEDQPDTVGHVAMEGYAPGSKWGREIAGELGYCVKDALRATLPVPACYPTIVMPTTLKKFVTGKGTGDKNQMLLGTYKKWGAEFTNDNENDAYALARLAFMVDDPEEPRLKYEEEVVKALHVHTERMSS